MDIHASIFPETIKVREGFNSDSTYQVGVSMDTTVTVHLTIEQARGLWYGLGTVLQFEDETPSTGKHSAYLDGKCVCGHLQSEHDDEPGSSHACMVPALSRGDFGCHCPSFKRDSLAVHYA